MAHKVIATNKLGVLLPRPEGQAASMVTSWYLKEMESLTKGVNNTSVNFMEGNFLTYKRKRSRETEDTQSKSQNKKISPAQPLEVASFRRGSNEKEKEGKLQYSAGKSLLPYPGTFVYEETNNKVNTVELKEGDISCLKKDGILVYLQQPMVQSARVTEDAESLRLQTEVHLYSFLRSHCYAAPRRVCTPTWLLTRLFQCYCLAADIPTAEVADSVVEDYVKDYFVKKHVCAVVKGTASVLGVAVYNDSPLHALWASVAVTLEKRKKSKGAVMKATRTSFTRCVMVHPYEAMSGIRLFSTDAGEGTSTGKFVVRAVARKLQQEHCCDLRELNKMEFGHLMCKGNRGINTARPQCRIMPPNRKDKQEYQYARVEPRPTPLLSRAHLSAAIQQRGFRLPRSQNLHLMRNAELQTSYSSGDGGLEFH